MKIAVHFLILCFLMSCAVAVRDSESGHSESNRPSENETQLMSDFQGHSLNPREVEVFDKRAVEKCTEMLELLTIIGDTAYDRTLRKSAVEQFVSYFRKGENRMVLFDQPLPFDLFLEKIYSGEIKIGKLSQVQNIDPLKAGTESTYEGKIGFSFEKDSISGHTSSILTRTKKLFGEEEKKVWEVSFQDLTITNDRP